MLLCASIFVSAIPADLSRCLADGKLELIPLIVAGGKDNRINIVAINRWTPGSRNPYNKPELREEFIADARHVLKAFDAADEAAIDPYPAYRNFFNVYAAWWADVPPRNPNDRDEGMHWEDYDEIKAFIHEFNHTAPGCPCRDWLARRPRPACLCGIAALAGHGCVTSLNSGSFARTWLSRWGLLSVALSVSRMTAALLDRLTHRCHIFEMNGQSYRFRESVKAASKQKV